MWCVWEEMYRGMFGAICCSFRVSWAQRWHVPNTLWITGRVWSVKPDPWHRMININPLPSAHTHPHISHSLKSVLRGAGWFLGQVLNQSDLLRLEWSMKATDWSRSVYLLQLTVCDCMMKDSLRLNEWMRWVVSDLLAGRCYRQTQPRLAPSCSKMLAQQDLDPIMNTNVDIIICLMPYSICTRQQGE